jgi:hypothetical protein
MIPTSFVFPFVTLAEGRSRASMPPRHSHILVQHGDPSSIKRQRLQMSNLQDLVGVVLIAMSGAACASPKGLESDGDAFERYCRAAGQEP